MVLKVCADAPKLDSWLDADLAQVIRVADAREHQELRRVEDAAREQHFACDRRTLDLAAPGPLHSGRAGRGRPGAAPVEQDPCRERFRLDGEIWPTPRRPQEGDGGAATPPTLDRP